MTTTQEIHAQVAGFKELLDSTRRSLQLVDERIAALESERPAVTFGTDVASEHKAAWFGARDVETEENGILLGATNELDEYGMANPHRGIIRIQEDAAFVCTDIMVSVRSERPVAGQLLTRQPIFAENPWAQVSENGLGVSPYGLALVDGNTGRNLTAGLSVGPLDRARGVIPFDYLSSIRPGLGSNVKNRLFAEFTIPRAGTVRVNVYNLGTVATFGLSPEATYRAFVTLIGFKVFGG